MVLGAPPSRRNALLVQLRPDLRARLAKHSNRTDLRLQPSVSTKSRVRRYLPVFGSRTIGPSPRSRPGLLAGSRRDDRVGLGRPRSAQRSDVPLHALVACAVAVLVHQPLVDAHRVATAPQGVLDDSWKSAQWLRLAVAGSLVSLLAGFAPALVAIPAPKSVVTSLADFWWPPPPPTRRAQPHPRVRR